MNKSNIQVIHIPFFVVNVIMIVMFEFVTFYS